MSIQNYHEKFLSKYLSGSDFELVCIKTHHCGTDNPGPHTHADFYELVVVTGGHAIHETETTRRTISTGSLLLLPPKQVHAYCECDNLEIYNLLFGVDFIRYFLPDLTGLPGFQFLFHPESAPTPVSPSDGVRLADEAFPQVVETLEEMIALRGDERPGNRMLLLSDFMRAFFFITRHAFWSNGEKKSRYVTPLGRLIAELDRNYAKPWTLEKMAACCRMSVALFRVEFKRYTGFSPVTYLLKLRLKKASVLLTAHNKTLDMVAFDCGFHDVSYFSRQFKQHYGMPPSLWH